MEPFVSSAKDRSDPKHLIKSTDSYSPGVCFVQAFKDLMALEMSGNLIFLMSGLGGELSILKNK